MTGKQKLDELFGITDVESIDSYLDSLSCDASKISDAMTKVEAEVLVKADQMDLPASEIAKPTALTILNIDLSLKEVEDLVTISKKIFKHVAENILTSDLIDSEIVLSLANLLEGIRLNIEEFMSVYKDKLKFAEKIKMKYLDQEIWKEREQIKQNYALERMRAKLDDSSVAAEGTVVFNMKDIVSQLDELDKQNDVLDANASIEETNEDDHPEEESK